ncbi:BPSS1780 family membrane protein [Jeongeupia wiesaeckerbachi]|uniref:BPSS1780 family membrane protein n=1 Tax=Jeongeupia wiesaeckerbachi TaxID=3051218 RepID=UPI003D80566B
MDNEIVIDSAPEARRLPAGDGWRWIVEAARLFRTHWLQWLLISLVFLVIVMGLSLLPFINVISTVLTPVLLGGVMWSAQGASQGRPPEIGDLFAGFRQRPRELFRVGLYYLIGVMVVALLLVALLYLFGLTETFEAWRNAETMADRPEIGSSGVLVVVLGLIGMLVVYSSYFFAPALVMLHGVSASEAMKLSLVGFWRNWLPVVLASAILSLLTIIAMIPMMLGLIPLIPIVLLTNYTAYADVFETR